MLQRPNPLLFCLIVLLLNYYSISFATNLFCTCVCFPQECSCTAAAQAKPVGKQHKFVLRKVIAGSTKMFNYVNNFIIDIVKIWVN